MVVAVAGAGCIPVGTVVTVSDYQNLLVEAFQYGILVAWVVEHYSTVAVASAD